MISQALQNIDQITSKLWIQVERINHPIVLTCEEADSYTPRPEYWLKSLLLKSKQYGMFCHVLNGRDKADLDLLKKILNDKRISFVSSQEWPPLVGSEPWAIAPFWHMVPIPILVSSLILDYPIVYFNPGINTCTYGITGPDFKKIWDHLSFKWI
jgi:Ala-tRNA(Pro) deacylase